MVLAVVMLLVSASTAAAVSIILLDTNPIAPGEGLLSGSSDLVLESQSLTYVGNNATGTDVVVNNTGASSHTVDIHYAIKNTTSGTVVESGVVSGQSMPANTATTVSITFNSEHPVDTFHKLEVNVEETTA